MIYDMNYMKSCSSDFFVACSKADIITITFSRILNENYDLTDLRHITPQHKQSAVVTSP